MLRSAAKWMSRLGTVGLAALIASHVQAGETVWNLGETTDSLGDNVVVEGHPRIVSWAGGHALSFDGEHDRMIVPVQPLVGAKTFTIEMVIRPDGGLFEQRFLHVAQTDPHSGQDSAPPERIDGNHRIMFELRSSAQGFYLDGFLNSEKGQEALATPTRLHENGQWVVVAQTYDGRMYRTYLNGVQDGERLMSFTPIGPGRVSIGARMNGISHFKGAIARVRFLDQALSTAELTKHP